MIRRPRARDLGLYQWGYPPGPMNAITDVAGVQVGQVTLIEGEGPLIPGEGPIRTGITAIMPHAGNIYRNKVPAAVHTINGFGKACGFEQVRELGTIETPILLTNTLNVGIVWDACVTAMLRQNPEIGITGPTVNPVVAETNDGYLNDIQGRHVRPEHVWQALKRAHAGQVLEGNVGAGTGTVAFGRKGGIGTASRCLPEEVGGFTLGVLVQANFGRFEDLMVDGFPAGRMLTDQAAPHSEDDSVVVVIATDAPCSNRQLGRLSRRAVLGLARVGSVGSHGSGDFVIAFSANQSLASSEGDLFTKHRPILAKEDIALSALGRAAMEGVEEAVINALLRAENMVGRDGHRVEAIPLEPLQALFLKEER